MKKKNPLKMKNKNQAHQGNLMKLTIQMITKNWKKLLENN